MKKTMNTYRRRLYRSRDGMVFGVCQGLADYSELSVFWLRVILIAAFIFSGFFPVVFLYLIAAIIMKLEPVHPVNTDDDLEFYQSYASDRAMALSRVRRKLKNLERRARRMESHVTAREFDWDARLRES